MWHKCVTVETRCGTTVTLLLFRTTVSQLCHNSVTVVSQQCHNICIGAESQIVFALYSFSLSASSKGDRRQSSEAARLWDKRGRSSEPWLSQVQQAACDRSEWSCSLQQQGIQPLIKKCNFFLGFWVVFGFIFGFFCLGVIFLINATERILLLFHFLYFFCVCM